MLVDCVRLGVPGVATRGLISFALASAAASFLLAMVSMVTNVVRAKFNNISCWRTVVLLAAARARLLSRPKAIDGCVRGGENNMGTTQWSTPPRLLKLALAFGVGQMKGGLQGSPRVANGQEALPIIHLLWEVLGSEDSCQGHHHEFNIGNRHASLLRLFLRILHHDDELGDVIHLHVVLGHV